MNILAAFIFFTRLPFWKIKEVPAECFKHVVPYWSLTSWLTGGIMAGTLWITGQILPISIAWITAIIVRLLVTGCLHEDGLADFLDGFGGGTTRERTLAYRQLRRYRFDNLLLTAVTAIHPSPASSLHACIMR